MGAGIFKTPSLVASIAGSATVALLLWVAGGAISRVGALCYAELVTAYPHPGGDYHYPRRACSKGTAFLFAWSRMTVLQTGSIALLAFVFGDYASQLFPAGPRSSAIFAGLLVVFLTAINFLGLREGKWTPKILTTAEIAGLLLIIAAGLTMTTAAGGPGPAAAPAPGAPRGTIGLALVFVLLTYDGWNEGLAVIVLRRRDPESARPFTVPLYPWTPLAFCASSAYMLPACPCSPGRASKTKGRTSRWIR